MEERGSRTHYRVYLVDGEVLSIREISNKYDIDKKLLHFVAKKNDHNYSCIEKYLIKRGFL